MANHMKLYDRLPTAALTGGWKVDDQEALKAQRGVVWEFLKTIGQKIMQGADLMGTPFPVYINEPRSYLEMLCDGWCTAPTYLTRAGHETDPLERLKLVITFAISGLHNTCHLGKPFNPILGETYQAGFEDGTEIYCEQLCHHPPITAWQLFGPDHLYYLYGYGEWTAAFRGNSVKGAQKGPLFVEFRDGTKIKYNLPLVLLNGVLWGDRIMEYEGVVAFSDEKKWITSNNTYSNTCKWKFFWRIFWFFYKETAFRSF